MTSVGTVEHVRVEVDAVSLGRREGDQPAVTAHIAEVVLDVLLDDERAWLAAITSTSQS